MAHIYPNNYRVLGNQPMNKVVMGKHILDNMVSLPKELGAFDLFPQLFVYAFDARVEPQTAFKMKLALTDYYDSVYLLDKEMYFDLRVEIDRNVTMHNHIRGGDYTVDFGVLPEGEHSISFQVIDSLGRKSQRLFYDILVRSYTIPESLTYRATLSDLTTYGITLGLTEASNEQLMKNNKIGLNKLMNDKKTAGFKKLVLPANGLYRVFYSDRDAYDPLNPYVAMPTGFTLDLNGSTIKLQRFLDKDHGANVVLRFTHCYDSHVINGTLDGDWVERMQLGGGVSDEGEACGSTSFQGNSKFCTLRNVTTKNVTGYNLLSTQANAILGGQGNWTDNRAINESNGQLITQLGYATSDITDITAFLASGQIACNIWLGYGGVVGNIEIQLSFYDQNQVFVEQIQIVQHRMCKIPLRSKFMRVTVKATAEECSSSLTLHNHATPKGTAFINCHWEKNRTCAAPAQFQHWMMRNCTFSESGVEITPCAVDLEDGWEQMQDFFLVDCDITKPVGTADLITNSGMNHHIEGCDNWRIALRGGITTRVVNGNTRSSLENGTGLYSRLSRYYDNDLTGFLFDDDSPYPQVIKNRSLVMGSNEYPPTVVTGGTYKLGDIQNNRYAGTTISERTDINPYDRGNNIFYACKFIGGEISTYAIHLNSQDKSIPKSQWLECTFEVPTEIMNHNYFIHGLWSECTFLDIVEINPHLYEPILMGDIQFNNCVFEKRVTYNNRPIQFNNCIFKQGVTCTGVSTSQFNNCTGA